METNDEGETPVNLMNWYETHPDYNRSEDEYNSHVLSYYTLILQNY